MDFGKLINDFSRLRKKVIMAVIAVGSVNAADCTS